MRGTLLNECKGCTEMTERKKGEENNPERSMIIKYVK